MLLSAGFLTLLGKNHGTLKSLSDRFEALLLEDKDSFQSVDQGKGSYFYLRKILKLLYDLTLNFKNIENINETLVSTVKDYKISEDVFKKSVEEMLNPPLIENTLANTGPLEKLYKELCVFTDLFDKLDMKGG